jgi:hypothetical protein
MRGWRVSRGREDCEPGAGTFAPGLNALLPRRPPGGRWLGWQAKSAGPGSGAGSAVSSYCLKKLLGLRLGGTASGSTERSCTTEGKDITYDIGLAGSLPANSDADGCVDHGTVEKGVGPTDDNFRLDCAIDADLLKKREGWGARKLKPNTDPSGTWYACKRSRCSHHAALLCRSESCGGWRSGSTTLQS